MDIRDANTSYENERKIYTLFVFISRLYCIRKTLNEHLDNAKYCPAIFRKELHESASKKISAAFCFH